MRTTVRDVRKGDRLREQLHAAAEFDDARLTIVQADLQNDAGWAEAVSGVDFVLRVASPTLRNGPVDVDQMVEVSRELASVTPSPDDDAAQLGAGEASGSRSLTVA